MKKFMMLMILCVGIYPVFSNTLKIIGTEAEPGETIDLGIELENSDAVAGIQIKLIYDSDVLTPSDAELTFRTSGFSISTNISKGELQVLLYSASGDSIPSGNGPVMNIPVNIASDARIGSQTLITFAEALLSDTKGNALAVNTKGGAIDIAENNSPMVPILSKCTTELEMSATGSYSVSTTDPDGDRVYYEISWGDGSTTGWQGVFDSGSRQSFNYSWSSEGSYAVRARAKDTNENVSDWCEALNVTVNPVGVEESMPAIKYPFQLSQNYPNPFNPSTSITFSLPEKSRVRLSVYDLLGKEVARLVDGEKSGGQHIIPFHAKELPSGIYLYKINNGNDILLKKMTLKK